MEQANMMPGNGMSQQNMGGMQRAQQGNQQQQVYAVIKQKLNEAKYTLGQGWHTTFTMDARANQVMQMVTNLRMLQSDPQQCLNVAMTFESKIIMAAQNKEDYYAQMKAKMNDIMRKRAENAQNAQNGMGMQPSNNNMMNMPGNGNGQMNQQNPAMLSHLQRPMQPSPLPMQDQQPTTLNPAALQNMGMPTQMSNVGPGMAQQNPAGQAMNMQEQQALMKMVKMIFDSMHEEQKAKLRTEFLANLPEKDRMEMANKPSDPLLRALLPRAKQEIAKQRARQQQQQNMNVNGMQMGQMPQAGAPGIDFSSIIAQQANAMKMQESGDQVVPASNNNSFTGGTMPQNVNPQMLANQNSQQANNNPQLQQLLMQQQQQQRMQQSMNVLAQRQAQQQQQQVSQLRGQPGGLNAPNALNGGPAGQVNSPAMSMLNRPMAPPGQAGPGTPQPNRPLQQPNNATANSAAQLLQHHQQMMNQNNQGINQPGLVPPQHTQPRTKQEIQAFFNDPQIRAKLSLMSPEERQQIMNGLSAGRGPQDVMAAMQNNAPPPMTNQASMPGAFANGQVMNGMPTSIGTNVPQFNAQPPSSQQGQQQPQMTTLQMQQRMQQQQRARATDIRPFPPQLLQQLGVAVPDNVKVWGQLKQHIHRHQSVLPPNTNMKVQQAQNQWFATHPEEVELGMQILRQQLQRQAQAQQANQQQLATPVGGPPGMPMANSQAPPAQMIPPTAPMQVPNQNGQMAAQSGMPQVPGPRPMSGPPPPTAIDVQNFRNTYPPAQGLSDDQVKEQIWKGRRAQHAKLVQQQREEALKHAQVQRTQQQANAQGQNGGQPPQQQQRPGQANNQSQAQGQKRPPQSVDNDDVMEIPNPNAPPQGFPMQDGQAQAMNQQRLGMNPHQYQMFMKMSPEKRQAAMEDMQTRRNQQAEALKKAQMGLPNNDQFGGPVGPSLQQQQQQQQQAAKNPLMQKINAMYAEVERNTPKGLPIVLTSEEIELAKNMLRRLWLPMVRMYTTFPLAASQPNFEKILQGAMRAKVQIGQQISDQDAKLKDYLSLGPEELKKVEYAMHVYFKEIKAVKERMDAGKARAGQQQQQQMTSQVPMQAPPQAQQHTPAATGKPASQPQAPPLNRTASHTRKASANSKAPPAPTEDKSFDWTTAGPHGVPKYESNRKELTPDKLKFPPTKKRRTGPESQDPTPAAQMGTPGALPSPSVPGKAQGQSQPRKSQPPLVKQEPEADRTIIRCSDPGCERSIKGFESEEELKKHESVEHAPIEDPLEFLLDNAAQFSGVDRDGLELPKPATIKTAPRATSVPAAKPGMKRDARTPNIKQEVSTPQGPMLSNKGQAKPTSTAAVASVLPIREKTLREVLEERMGFVPLVKPMPVPEDTAAPTNTDNGFNDLMLGTLGDDEGISDWTGDFAGVTDWGLRPDEMQDMSSPELTPPSDAVSQSSRSSDISEAERLRINFEWDPFGNGDTQVPEALRRLTLGLGASPSNNNEDVDMTDGDGEKNEKKADVDEWDWSADERTDWNTLFGANAGLEGL
ncbi:hypothetical protein LTR56_000794 [Elasticomyces elasticus]|nr:hypothetical protein LTR22_009049 [Elasticomyces elasticus]KAK3660418.1 hypothetical protein LTR56_000794 [Elasticomyces elasticus]KAK4929190.1 hypothetical protein LTR49_004087 [Elasticomyces elasticus]